MPRSANPARLTKLKQRAEAVQRQIRAIESEGRDQARKDETRMKVIAGALALEHTEKNPSSEFAKVMLRLLDEYTRPTERRLFPFLPARDLPPETSQADEHKAAE